MFGRQTAYDAGYAYGLLQGRAEGCVLGRLGLWPINTRQVEPDTFQFEILLDTGPVTLSYLANTQSGPRLLWTTLCFNCHMNPVHVDDVWNAEYLGQLLLDPSPKYCSDCRERATA
jgi:hypothetical protein